MLKINHHIIGLHLLFSLCVIRCAGQSVIYNFSGQITQERASASVFTGGIGDTFSGSFSYDPTASSISPQGWTYFYPLTAFSIDGHSLNVPNGTEIPYLPGVGVRPGMLGFIEIRGFYLPASATDPTDNGSTSLMFVDASGLVITNPTLPSTLELSEFSSATITGPIFVSSPAPTSDDQGIITELVLAPEPTCPELALLALTIYLWSSAHHRYKLPRAA
jgi:hypothetical protein